jgi:hypothetical protein
VLTISCLQEQQSENLLDAEVPKSIPELGVDVTASLRAAFDAVPHTRFPMRSSSHRILRVVMLLPLATFGASTAGVGTRDLAPLVPRPPSGMRVLFIGNSLTYVNDLPWTVSNLAALTGDTLQTAQVAFPDYALEDHATQGDAVRAINHGGWQYVVLQQGPSSLDSSRQTLIKWTVYFDRIIRSTGAHTALYMVWPSVDNFSTFPRAIDSYKVAAKAVNGLLLPGGAAWLAAWAKDSTLQLYAPDGLHASPLGTYLVALVIYERLTGRDARNLPLRVSVGGATFSVPNSTVRLLQNSAHETNVRFSPALVH